MTTNNGMPCGQEVSRTATDDDGRNCETRWGRPAEVGGRNRRPATTGCTPGISVRRIDVCNFPNSLDQRGGRRFADGQARDDVFAVQIVEEPDDTDDKCLGLREPADAG